MTESRDTVRSYAGPDQVVEIHEPEKAPRRRTVVGVLDMGCECEGEVLDDAEVSRRHAALRPTGGRIELEDLGSTNGTFVNRKRVSGAQPLRTGDRVQLGPHVLEVVA